MTNTTLIMKQLKQRNFDMNRTRTMKHSPNWWWSSYILLVHW